MWLASLHPSLAGSSRAPVRQRLEPARRRTLRPPHGRRCAYTLEWSEKGSIGPLRPSPTLTQGRTGPLTASLCLSLETRACSAWPQNLPLIRQPSTRRSRVAPMHCCIGAPSDPYVPLVAAYGSSKPRGRSGVEGCWFSAGAGCPALAVRVDEAGARPVWPCPVGGHVLLGDRFAGDPVPLFPLGGAVWLVVGVQEQVPAEGAASVLLGEQEQDAAVEQGLGSCRAAGPSSRSGRGRPGTPRRGPDCAGRSLSSRTW